MAAQFEDKKIPDQNCSRYKFEIKNGFYKVEILQYYNVDNNEYVGEKETDILLNFIKASDIEAKDESVFWCTY